MYSTISRRCLRFASVGLGAVAAFAVASAAIAQSRIAIDGSLGGDARTIAPNGQELFIPSADGRQRGEALFHSFSAFDLRAGDRAVFGTPAETTRIISRVTGSEGALIDGTVRIDRFGGVDFWMISPNGLVVGPNANIDTEGAVHLSTGDELRFSDGAIFSADPSTALTLTSAPPSAFGFNQAPARLEVRGDGLEVVIDDVTLAGGSVEIRDARIGSSFGGQVLIAGAAAGDVVAVERRTVDALSTGPATLDGEVRIVGDPTAPEEARTRVGFGGSGVVALEGRRVRIDGA
ncbi:MAG: filamentous hemagglutinin N-terminal domain-containing protein, partial [Pseudomonadota bacterium]